MKEAPKILLIGDTPGWAFDHIITFVRTQITDYDFYFDFTVYNPRQIKQVHTDVKQDELNQISQSQIRKTWWHQKIPGLRGFYYRRLNRLNAQGLSDFDGEGRKRRVRADHRYDAVMFLDYYMDKDADFDRIEAEHVIRGIYTASFPPKGIALEEGMDVATFCKEYLADASMIVVGAPEIMELYRPHLTNLHFANLAYDEMRFQRRKNAPGAGLTLGWTGNPNRDFKGFHSLIVPVIEELKQEGYPITLKTQFSGSLESLADFWQEVDLAVIASEADAGPSLFMEASLCGVPSISTRIGMPKYVIRDGENGIFIERSKEALRAALLRVFEDRVLLADMQEAIRRDYIGLLGFAVQKENWKSLFARVFSTRQSEST